MKLRVALFCSLYRGVAMMNAIQEIQKRHPAVVLTGVVTDDPSKPWTNADKRIWKHSRLKEHEEMIEALAHERDIPLWKGKVNTSEFHDLYFNSWKPDVCYMGVFGQKIPEKFWSYPLFGFYNFHTCGGEVWPSDVGGDPLTSLFSQGKRQAAIAMHEVDNEWDHGDLLAFSDFFPIDPETNPIETQKLSAHLAGEMMSWHLSGLLGEPMATVNEPRFIADDRFSTALSRRTAA